MSGKVKGKRRGRPPGSKNKVKEEELNDAVRERLRTPIARSNGVRKISRPRSPRSSFLQVSPKYQKLIQKWSNETKIGMQQVLDDILLAGANAAHKSFYRGLINSRKATEALFDAETNTETNTDVVVAKPVTESESESNGLSDSKNIVSIPRARIDEERPSLAPVGSRRLEETDTDLGESYRIGEAGKHFANLMEAAIIDAPPTTTPEEERVEEDDNEPPY